MKKIAIISSALLFILALSISFNLFAQNKSFTGEVMDSPCALLGGHDKMAQKGESDKDCTLRCVKAGGKYALFNAADKSWYTLDDQKKAEAFAGQKVVVTGAADAATKTLKVATIKAAPKA
jgi:hypothetical protein